MLPADVMVLLDSPFVLLGVPCEKFYSIRILEGYDQFQLRDQPQYQVTNKNEHINHQVQVMTNMPFVNDCNALSYTFPAPTCKSEDHGGV